MKREQLEKEKVLLEIFFLKSNREREMENMREKPRHIEAQALIIRYPLNQKRENK